MNIELEESLVSNSELSSSISIDYLNLPCLAFSSKK